MVSIPLWGPSKTAAATAAASKSADLKRTENPSSRDAYNAKRRKQAAEASAAAAAASGNSKPCVCSTCGKGYANTKSLRKHVRQNHELL